MEDLPILTEKLRSPDEETRRVAVAGLAGHPLSALREALFLAMGDPSWRVRKETVETLQTFPFSPEMVELLVEMLRSHDNAGMRNSAVETLERLGSPAVPLLARHIGDDDQDVRKFVIDILGHAGNPAVVPQLVAALADSDPNVSAAAAENLGRIGDSRAIPDLLRALASTNLWLRYTVLEALTRIGAEVPFAVIAPLAGEEFLKKAVYDCLGVVGDAEAVPLLVEGLSVKPKRAREAAAVALVKLQGRLSDDLRGTVAEALRCLAGTPAVEALLASLDGAEKGLKEALIVILGTIGDARAMGSLLGCCHDEWFRRQCLAAFRNMGDAGERALVEAFATGGDDERCLIAYVCGELGYLGCRSQLQEGMRDPYWLLRKVAVAAAGRLGLTALTGEVALLLDDAEPEVRDTAITVLSRFATQDREGVLQIATELSRSDISERRRNAALLFSALGEVERLSRLVKDEEAPVRKAAVAALADLKAPSTAGVLVMALADEEAEVRIAAAGALGTVGGEGVIEPLLLALQDEDIWVRSAALKSLGRLRDERVVPALEEMLETAEGLVMVSVLEALAETGTTKAFELVARALDHRDEDVVKAAINCLDKGGDAWLDHHWQSLIAHPHWDVRMSFIRILVQKWGQKAVPHLQQALSTESDDLVKGQIADLLDRIR